MDHRILIWQLHLLIYGIKMCQIAKFQLHVYSIYTGTKYKMHTVAGFESYAKHN